MNKTVNYGLFNSILLGIPLSQRFRSPTCKVFVPEFIF